VGLQTWGSEGDVSPFLALGGALRGEGIDVVLNVFTTDDARYEERGESMGIEVNHIGGLDPGRRTVTMEALLRARFLSRQGSIAMNEMLRPSVDALYRGAKALYARCDIVVGHFLSYPLSIVAEAAGKPYVALFPTAAPVPSPEMPPSGFPDFGRRINSLLWKIAYMGMNRLIADDANRIRGMEGVPSERVGSTDLLFSSDLNIVSVSPTIFPFDTGRERMHVCGAFGNANSSRAAPLPESSQAFLEDGRPVIFVTFGSLGAVDPFAEETLRLLSETVNRAGVKAIIQHTWPRHVSIGEHPSLYCVERVDHASVFPSCSLVVHHGGAGTSRTAAMCGCPSIVVAHAADQRFNGALLKRAGVCTHVLRRGGLTVGKLASAITEALSAGPRMVARVKDVAQRMRAEDGLGKAMELIAHVVPAHVRRTQRMHAPKWR